MTPNIAQQDQDRLEVKQTQAEVLIKKKVGGILLEQKFIYGPHMISRKKLFARFLLHTQRTTQKQG